MFHTPCMESFLHCGNILMKSFAMLIADITKICWEKFKLEWNKCIFSKIHQMQCVKYLFNQLNIILFGDLLLPRKLTSFKDCHPVNSILFRSSSKRLSFISSLICWPENMPSHILVSLMRGSLSLKIFEPFPSLFNALTKFFTCLSFVWGGGKKILLSSTSGSWRTFLWHGNKCLRRGHWVVGIFCRTVSLTNETTILRIP